MESASEGIENNAKNMYVPICITQAICIAVILISVLIIKFFFKDCYAKLHEWCKENFLDQMQITAFLQEENGNET